MSTIVAPLGWRNQGSGKTAVGLHRAAYLLYTHRQRLRRTGVLVVGPNPAFLRYISAVLPALGEVDVEQHTLDGLLARHPARAVDGDAAAAVKHDVRMADVLHRALYGRIGAPTEPLTVADGSFRWRVPAAVLRRTVDEIRREAPPYGIGRERLRSRIVELLRRQAERRVELPGSSWTQRMGRCRPVRELLDRVWPAVSPEELVAGLLSDPRALAGAADGILTPAEQEAIRWARPRRARTASWSAADAVLLDEAAGLVDHLRGYGHIVVDEAQDLSAMQCRALARRSPHGSLTVLGDLAQGTTPWAAANWPEQLAHLGMAGAAVVTLTAGFRVPAAVLRLANRLLDTLAVDVPPTRSVRSDGEVRLRHADDLATAAVVAVRGALRQDGSIGVISADAATDRLADALRGAGIRIGDADGVDAAARVTVLPASLAKGLEYDHVVVVEPADIVDAELRGPNRLYVALTRAVSRLDIVYHRPLPPAIRD